MSLSENPPRVTLDDVANSIVDEQYFTAAEGALKAGTPVDLIPPRLNLLTFCVLTLRNGFVVTGESSCVSAESFDAAIGRRLARDQAVNKIWPLLGYELRSHVAAQEKNELAANL